MRLSSEGHPQGEVQLLVLAQDTYSKGLASFLGSNSLFFRSGFLSKLLSFMLSIQAFLIFFWQVKMKTLMLDAYFLILIKKIILYQLHSFPLLFFSYALFGPSFCLLIPCCSRVSHLADSCKRSCLLHMSPLKKHWSVQYQRHHCQFSLEHVLPNTTV